MNITEIMLIIAGVIVLFLGYALPAKKKELDDDLQLISENEVRKLIDQESEGVKEHISDIIDETVTYAIEKTERSMERVANEKIMAINEYSDTVLEEINKNHKEVLFLYDMLNDKHENLKTTISEATGITEEVKQTLKDAEITAREAKEAARGIEETAKGIEETTKEAEKTEKSRIDTIFDDGFVPIMPPRVEIIHNPDGDYVAPKVDTTEPVKNTPKRARKTSQYKSRNKLSEKSEKIEEEIKSPKKSSKVNKELSEPEAEYDAWKQFVPVNDAVYSNEVSDEKLERRAFSNFELTSSETDRGYNYEHISQIEESENVRNSNDRILELHKAGKSNMTIAKELGLGIGEVKLVIDLFEGL